MELILILNYYYYKNLHTLKQKRGKGKAYTHTKIQFYSGNIC